MNKKKIIIFLSIILFVFICIFMKTEIIDLNIYKEYYLKKMYGEPIELTTGIINNTYFNIKMDGTDARKTTEGINRAIRYAKEHNIEYIKLQTGVYLINGTEYNNGERGIQVLSNITLDLNASILKHESTDKPGYVICNIENVENVKVLNGILIGDKETHDYDSIVSKHEWGMGIQVLGSNEIQVMNLEIYNMTGDGVYVSESNNIKSDSVIIENLAIHDCRRQGVSIITGNNIIIRNNEIWNIMGCGVDFERNFDIQTCNNTQIYNNIFYYINNPKYAILVHDGISNLDIFENKLYDATIQVSYPNDTIKVYNNQIN